MSAISTILLGLGNGFIDLALLPYRIWQWWQLDTLKEQMSKLLLAGQSIEFLYIVLSAVLLLVVVSLFSRRFYAAQCCRWKRLIEPLVILPPGLCY